MTYEFLDNSMKDDIVIVAFPRVHHKILHRFRCNVREKTQVNIAHISMYDGEFGCSNALLLRRDSSQSLFFSRWLFVEYISVEAFVVGVAVKHVSC